MKNLIPVFIFVLWVAFAAYVHAPKKSAVVSVKPTPQEDFVARSTTVSKTNLWARKGHDSKDIGRIVFAKTTDVLPANYEGSQMYYNWPSVAVKLNDAWIIHEFRDLPAFDWMGTYVDERSGRVWGFLEQHTGDQGESLIVLLSANWGRTWKEMGIVYKPHYTADFVNFHMESGGKGFVVFAMDSEFEKSKKTESDTVYYKAHTGDLGKTWQLEKGPFVEDRLSRVEESNSMYCSSSLQPSDIKDINPKCRIDLSSPY